jgi:hypothetical protein
MRNYDQKLFGQMQNVQHEISMKIYLYQNELQGYNIGKFKFYTSVYVEITVRNVVNLYIVTDHVNVWKGT